MGEVGVKSEIQVLEECLQHLRNARSELLRAERLIQPTWGSTWARLLR